MRTFGVKIASMGALMFTLQKHEKLMMFPKIALHPVAPVKGSETHFRDAHSPLFEEISLFAKVNLKSRRRPARNIHVRKEKEQKKRR